MSHKKEKNSCRRELLCGSVFRSCRDQEVALSCCVNWAVHALQIAGSGILELSQQTCKVSLVGKSCGSWHPAASQELCGQDVLKWRRSPSIWTPAFRALPSALPFHTSDNNIISHVLYSMSVLVCALSSKWGQNWQGARFVFSRVFSCDHWCQLVWDGKKELVWKGSWREKQLCLAKLINVFL